MVSRESRSEFPPPASVKRWLAALALLWGSALAAPMELEVIKLRHRLVGDVIPVLQPFVAPGGTLSGMGEQLIVKTTPGNLEELKRVLDRIDTRQRRLKITVRQDALDHAQAGGNAFQAEVGGPLSARTRAPRLPGGASIGIDTPDGGVRYQTYGTESADSTRDTHFVRTIEGEPAFIQTGQSVPLPTYGAVPTPYGPVVQPGMEYRDVSSGVYVTPRVQGDNVVLEVNPQLERLDPGRPDVVHSRRAAAMVRGRLGEWIPLGGASEARAGSDDTTIASTRRRGDSQYNVWVKVEAEEP